MPVPQPHDAFFKQVFCRPELAADLIRRRLPRAAVAALDLDRLERVEGEFIDDALRNRRADLVFRAPLRAAEQHAVFHVLVEHRSTPGPLVPFQLMGYAMHLLTAFVEQHRAEHGHSPRRLPVIIPLLVYQGARPWRGPRDLVELFDLPPELHPALGPYLPRMRLLIDDLAADDPPETPTALSLTAAVLLTMRYVRDETDPEGFAERWRSLLDAAAGEPHAGPIVEASARYLYDVSDRLGPDVIVRTARAIQDPETREALMTLAEKFEELGRQKGLEQGLEQGFEQGRQEALVEVLLKQLRLKFGPLPADVNDRLLGADAALLDTLTARVLTAGSLTEVFADPI